MAAGHLGQRTVIVPSAELVVARTGHSPSASFNARFDELLARRVRAVSSVEPGAPSR